MANEQARASGGASILQTLIAERVRVLGGVLLLAAALLLLLPPLLSLHAGWNWTLFGLGALFALPFAVAGATFVAPPNLFTLDRLAGKRREVGYALFALAILAAGVAIFGLSRYSWTTAWPLIVWGSLLAVLFTVAAAYHAQPHAGSQMTEIEQLRAVLMTTGAVAGFLTSLLGLALPLIRKDYADVLRKGVVEWRADPGVLTTIAIPLFGGLMMMFLAVQLARSFERTRATLRRLLYGYTAVLDGLLLITILLLANLLPYTGIQPFSSLNKPSDWTTSRMYTLQPASQQALGNLKAPVKVYVLLSVQDERRQMTKDIDGLLENCRNVTDQISWEVLSPDRRPDDLAKLESQYSLPQRYGLLVVYGVGPTATNDFIKREELYRVDADPSDPRGGRLTFVGEAVLMKSIDFLVNGKAKQKIYFTQGEGELTVGPTGGDRESVSQLVQRLGRGNYEVKELQFSGEGAPDVPDDAGVVVIARPHLKFSTEALNALRRYMDGGEGRKGKKGKLFVLLDAYQVNRELVSTGLEEFLARYGVKVEGSASRGAEDPSAAIEAVAIPRSGTRDQSEPHPIGNRFERDEGILSFPFRSARLVEPTQGDPKFASEILMVDPRGRRALGVMVSEMEAAEGNPHAMTPRLVVMGSASWITNLDFRSRDSANGDLFMGCISWLSQRQDFTGSGKDPAVYMPILTKDAEVEKRVYYLPGFLAILIVLALGGGVWLVRRR